MAVKFCNIAIFICLWFSCEGYSIFNAENDWDYLIFSQKWPMTFCIYYSDYMTDPVRFCNLPKDRLQWTVHGLWPNKWEGMGPFFCNMSARFDVDSLKDIETKLEIFWPNLEGDKSVYSLWQHEWLKHGTCTLNFETLNNEFKYFKGGLDFYSMYNMSSILSPLNIFPDKTKKYSVEDIIEGVQKIYNKRPYIQCVHMQDTHKYYLSEIRLCFNKDYQMINCGTEESDSVTNCPAGYTIIYPKNVKDE